MKRVLLAGAVLGLLLLLAGCEQPEEDIQMTIYKSPNCGCCVGYSSAMDNAGFDVKVVEVSNMQEIKAEYGVPANMESCHTSRVGDYFVEGHVPKESVNKLLSEKPDIDGIALPNMPSGSPGMPGPKRGQWQIYAVSDGQVSNFMTI